MGDLVIKKHKTSRLMNNEHDDDGSHLYFVTDMAGKANLEATITRYSLGEQIRDGSYPLLMAIQSGTTCPVVQTMLRGNIMENRLLLQTNKFGETALHLALLNAEEHDHGVITMLLQSSKNSFLVEAKEKRHGNLPIHIAAMRGCSATIVDQLLSLEPDSIFGKNRAGKTPLDLAIEYGHCREEVVRLLEISEHH
jgi:ankyrin repeat protein